MSKLRGGTKFKWGMKKAVPTSADHLLYVSSKDLKAGKRPKLMDERPLSKVVRSRAAVKEMDTFSQSIEEEYRKRYGRINPSVRGRQQRAAGFKRVAKALGGRDSLVKYKINRLRYDDNTKQTVRFRESGKKTGTYTPKREVLKKMTKVDFSKVFYTPNTTRPQIPGISLKAQGVNLFNKSQGGGGKRFRKKFLSLRPLS